MLPSIFGENLFDDWFDGFDRDMNRIMSRSPLYGKNAARLMKTDVHETENAYELAVDLPGFKKEDVSAELKDGYLTVSAVKNHENDQKNEEGRLIRQERYSGSCSRTFWVGENVDEKDCQAAFENGILTVEVPKIPVHQEPEKRMIAIA